MTGERIGIVGAGRQAAETASYLRSLGCQIAFFSKEEGSGEGTGGGKGTRNEPPAGEAEGIGRIDIAEIPEGQQLITAVGYPEVRRKLVSRLGERAFFNCITSVIEPGSVRGVDVTIAPGCVFTTNISIGSHVLINIGCNISHDAVIGDFVTISPGVNIAGVCEIGEGAFIGIGATIVDHVKIGKNCVIGAGAVVIGDVPDGATVVGVPARPID